MKKNNEITYTCDMNSRVELSEHVEMGHHLIIESLIAIEYQLMIMNKRLEGLCSK